MDLARLIRQTFDYRTNRIIATCRVVFALLFASFLQVDPAQPVRSNDFGFILLTGYAAVTFAVMVIAWRNWWLDHVLARPVLGIDVFVFITAVFYTETTASGFVSPFLSFFAFLMLSSNSRWGWRATAWMAVIVLMGFVLVGLDLHHMGVGIDLMRFSRRIAYMTVMSLVLVWFGSQNVGIRVPRFMAPDATIPLLIEDSLGYAMRTVGATMGAIAWSDRDEPRVALKTAGLKPDHPAYFPLNQVDLSYPREVLLFDAEHMRELALDGLDRIVARSRSPVPGIARTLDLNEGLCIPLSGSTGTGQLILSGIRGMSTDHLHVGLEIGREIALAMDRLQLAIVTNEAAMMRMRSSIARDLHDSLAQSLAGANFRLQGLRAIIAKGDDPIPEIVAIQTGLSGEQVHVRTIIQRLRQEDIAPGERDINLEIKALVPQLQNKWDIMIDFADSERPMPIPALLVFEVQQLIREAVANAVRHGHADRISISLARTRHDLILTVGDNGKGFPADGPTTAPRSLAERVGELGGALVISSREGNTRITITLPSRGRI